jgi:hypothetical protein
MKKNRRYLCGNCDDIYGRDINGKNFRFSKNLKPHERPAVEAKTFGLRTCGDCRKK